MTRATTRAIVPMKSLAESKSRLAVLLAPAQRRALARAMFLDVVEVLVGHPRLRGIALVSADPEVLALAADCKLESIEETPPRGGGLNAAVAAAAGACRAASDRLLVVHADLPLLAGDDIDAALAGLSEGADLVIGTDRAGRGSNLLGFRSAAIPDFRFGEGSCQRHCDWAREAGMRATVLQRSGIASDIDAPEDLVHLLDPRGPEPGPRTAAVVRNWPQARIMLPVGRAPVGQCGGNAAFGGCASGCGGAGVRDSGDTVGD